MLSSLRSDPRGDPRCGKPPCSEPRDFGAIRDVILNGNDVHALILSHSQHDVTYQTRCPFVGHQASVDCQVIQE